MVSCALSRMKSAIPPMRRMSRRRLLQIMGAGAAAIPAASMFGGNSALAAPLARLCDALCPGEGRPACRRTAFEALGSHDALLTLGSPVESLVAQDAFLSSPRGRATVLRRILMAAPMRGRRAMLARIETESQCLGVALVEEAHRYRPASIRTVQDG